jgi:hypothetical protein
MSDDARHVRGSHAISDVVAAVAALAGTIERAAADLSLAEEPSNFIAALEEAAADA